MRRGALVRAHRSTASSASAAGASPGELDDSGHRRRAARTRAHLANARRTLAGRAAMTWAELHGVSRAPQRHRRRAPRCRAEAERRRVTGIAYDSRTRRSRARCSSRSRASTPTAPRSRSRRSSAARWPSCRRQPPPADVAAPWIDRQRRAAGAGAARRRVLSTSQRRDAGGRHHRHQRQDDDRVSGRVDLRRGRHSRAGCSARWRTASAARIREATRTTPEAPDVQRLLREMVDAGCGACAMEVSSHALSLQPRGRDDVSPPACSRTSRAIISISTATWRRTSAPSAAVRDAAARTRPSLHQPRRSARRVARRDGAASGDLRDRRGPPTSRPGPLSFSLGRTGVRRPDAARHAPRSARRWSAGPNVYNILAAVATAVALDLPFDAIERGVAALDGVPGRFQVVSGRRRRRHGRRRLRAHRRCAAEPARDGAAAGPRTADHGVRLRRRSRSHQAAADGRRGGPPERRHRRSRPTTRAARIRARIIEEIQRGITAGHPARRAQRLLSIVDRARGDRQGDRAGAAGRPGADRRQGSRKVSVIGDRVLPFDDVAVAREALMRRRSNSGVV